MNLEKDAGFSLDMPFHYRNLETALWVNKIKEAETRYKIKIPDSAFTGQRKCISFKIPSDKKLSLDEMLQGKKDPLYWQFGAALHGNPGGYYFRCQILDNKINIKDLVIDNKKDSWFVVPANQNTDDSAWEYLEKYLGYTVENHVQNLGPAVATANISFNISKKPVKKEEKLFSFGDIEKEIWRNKIAGAQEFFKIFFDID